MKTYNNIDLQFNQLLSALAEKVEVLPEPTTLTEKQTWAGRIAYSTSVQKFHYYKYVNETDSKWVPINDLAETLDTIGDSTLTISEEDKIITKDSNGYGFKTIGDILQLIIDNQQDTIESERLEYYRKDIGTDTEGIVYQKEHNLSNYFPIHFTFKYTDSEGWEQEVLIDHQRNMATNDFKWSIVTPYSADNLARIILVGYKGKVTETERDLMGRYAYGIQWQATALGTASPTRIGNLDLHASLPIQSGMKGCIWNRTDGIKYYLDENDWSKKADGTDS
ncbi:MAG: hypothetical protein J6N78_04075, partial [Clostridia bacterium]|nr:hypothetical protein [Clostridia bacterium]